MFGLFFGLLGDAFLVYDEFFVLGMIAFGVGHLFYISAFEYGRKLNIPVGLSLLALLVIILDSRG